jgi:hypothetical protein
VAAAETMAIQQEKLSNKKTHQLNDGFFCCAAQVID